MNRPGFCLALVALLLQVGAADGAGSSDTRRPDFIPLADWARTHNYQYVRTRGSDLIQLTSSSTRLVFALDSQRVDINGVGVLLCAPITLRGGEPCLSSLDIETTIVPVLFPVRSARAIPVVHICLDAGHGGKDPGNEDGRLKEKDHALSLAIELRRLLTESGMKVTMTRQNDTFVPLTERPEIAAKRGADLFVSLHFNAAIASRNEVQGVEVYCLTPAGARSTYARGDLSDAGALPGNRFDARNVLLAYQIEKAIARQAAMADRGVKRARFAVLRTAQMPAVLIEAGFMSHPTESKRIADPEHRRRIARAIVDGILAYKKAIEP